MPIIIDKFGGMNKRIAPDKLEGGQGQDAQNVATTSGALSTLSFGTFKRLWADSGADKYLNGEIPYTEAVRITKPNAPTVNATTGITKICNPYTHWLTSITATLYVCYLDANGQYQENPQSTTLTLNSASVTHTQDGLIIRGLLANQTFTGTVGRVYDFYGPIYTFNFSSDATYSYAYGGPSGAAVLPPSSLTYSMPLIPVGQVPLYKSAGVQYGAFQVIDMSGPVWSEKEVTYIPSAGASWIKDFKGGDVFFTIDLNYTQRGHRYFYFCQSYRDTAKREGPASDPSAMITLKPGEKLTLTTTSSSTYDKMRIYCNAGDGFSLRDEVAPAATWVFSDQEDQGIPLPPQNWCPVDPTSSTYQFPTGASAKLAKSVVHPSNYGLLIVTDGNNISTIRPTDIYRLNCYPEEWGLNTFQCTLDGMVTTGGTVLAFSLPGSQPYNAGKVWAISGNNPESLDCRFLNDISPPLSQSVIGRIGDTVYWVSNDGLVACNGSSYQVITNDLFDMATWKTALNLTVADDVAKLGLYVQENRILIHNANTAAKSLLLEMDNGRIISASQLYSMNWSNATLPTISGDSTWTSPTYRFDQPVIMDYVRLFASGGTSIEVTAYYNGTSSTTTVEAANYNSYNGTALVLGPAKEWYFKLKFNGAVTLYKAEFLDRKLIPVDGDSITLTPENAPNLGDTWLKFPDRDRFVAYSVDAPAGTTLKLALTKRDGTTSLHANASVAAGTAYKIPRTDWTSLEDVCRLKLTDTDDAEISQGVDVVRLFCRRAEAAGKVIREINPIGGIPPWLIKSYEFEGQVWVKSVFVSHTASNLKLNAYIDGSSTATPILDLSDIAITSGKEVRIATPIKCSRIEFEFVDKDTATTTLDHLVQEVVFQTRQAREVTGPVTVSGEDSYRGLMFAFPDKGAFACAQIAASDSSAYSVQLNLYRDGTALNPQPSATTDGFIFTLGRQTKGALWEADILPAATSTQIHSATLYPWVRVPVPGNELRLTASDDTGIPDWLWHIYTFEGGFTPVSGVVFFEGSAPMMTVYKDGVSVAHGAGTLVSGKEFRFTQSVMTKCGSLEVSFSDNRAVKEVIFYGRREQPVGDGPVTLTSPPWRSTYLATSEPMGVPAAAQIVASDTCTLHLRVGGTDKLGSGSGTSVADSVPVYNARTITDTSTLWESDVEGAGSIDSVTLWPRTRVPVQDDIVLTGSETQIAPWGWQIYEPPTPTVYSGGIVHYTGDTALDMLIYADGSPTASATIESITSGQRFNVSLAACKSVEFAFVSHGTATNMNHVVKQVNLFARKTVPVQGKTLHLTAADPNNPPWWDTDFVFEGGALPVSAIVKAKAIASYPLTLNLYPDSAPTAFGAGLAAADGKEFKLEYTPVGGSLTAHPRCNTLALDFGTGDDLVAEVFIFCEDVIPVGPTGLILPQASGQKHWLGLKAAFTDTGSFDVARVQASAAVTLTLTTIGPSGTAGSSQSFTLSDNGETKLVYSGTERPNSRLWRIDASCDGEIYQLALVGRVTQKIDAATGALWTVTRSTQDPWSWLCLRAHTTKPLRWRCGRVRASSYPEGGITVQLYKNGVAYGAALSVTSERPFNCHPGLGLGDEWTMDVTAAETVEIKEVGLATGHSLLQS